MQLSTEECIRRLILRYPTTIDNGDVEGVVNLFAKSTLSMGAGSVLHGEEEVREFFSQSLRRYADGQTFVRHHVTNMVIDVDDNGRDASASSYYVTFQQITGVMPLQPIISGGYEDTFVKDDDGWRFDTRRFLPLLRGDISNHVTPASGWNPATA